jgi:4'-phosphopantetheinyl transferase
MAELLALPPDEVHLWLVQPEALVLDRALFARWGEVLSAEERARAEGCHLERTRTEQLVARGLVRTTLSRYADVDPTDWTFRANTWGRPEIDGPEGTPTASSCAPWLGLAMWASTSRTWPASGLRWRSRRISSRRARS